MCRGDRGEDIFLDDVDRERFLETLREARERTGWSLHAYVLMGNHYHLLLETPEPNLVAGMRWFQGTYTIRFNHRHGLSGHLFQGRYKALPVAPEEEGYFLRVSTYIHLNPVRAGLVTPEASSLASYEWSSYPEYVKPARKRSGLVEVDRVLGDLGLADCARDRKEYQAYTERRCLESLSRQGRAELESEWKDIRRGWYLGSDAFRKKVQELVGTGVSDHARSSYSGGAVRAHDEQAATELLKKGLAGLGVTETELMSMRKLDVRKQVLAWWVRKRTMVSNRWVSETLHMGDSGNVSKVIKTVEEGRGNELRLLKKQVATEGEIPKSED